MFDHFMLLSVAIRILCDVHCVKEQHMIHYSRQLLRTFVKEMPVVYKDTSIVYNIHSLIHLPDDVERLGALDSWSAFRYESYLGNLKRKVQSGRYPLQQICKRIYEYTDFEERKTHSKDERPSSFRLIPGKSHESCVRLYNDKNFIVISMKNNLMTVRGFQKPHFLFTKPCQSNKLGIVCFKRLEQNTCTALFSEVKNKCLPFKCWGYYIVIPYLH